MKLSVFVGALCLTANMACADGHLTNAPANLVDVNDQFNTMAAAGDAEGLTNLYADDTLWIEQGKRVSQGLAGPRQLFEFVTANKGNVTHTIDHLFVSDDETLAVMIGSVEAVVESVGMDATGTYLFVLEPQDDGWEIVTDMWHQHVDQ
jgi:ketosteroid isomerase-like protein